MNIVKTKALHMPQNEHTQLHSKDHNTQSLSLLNGQWQHQTQHLSTDKWLTIFNKPFLLLKENEVKTGGLVEPQNPISSPKMSWLCHISVYSKYCFED